MSDMTVRWIKSEYEEILGWKSSDFVFERYGHRVNVTLDYLFNGLCFHIYAPGEREVMCFTAKETFEKVYYWLVNKTYN